MKPQNSLNATYAMGLMLLGGMCILSEISRENHEKAVNTCKTDMSIVNMKTTASKEIVGLCDSTGAEPCKEFVIIPVDRAKALFKLDL